MHYMKQIIHNTVGNLYWKDLQGKYLGCNKEFAKLVGLSSPDEISGKTDYDLWNNIDYVRIILQNDQEIINSGNEKIFEEVGLDINGHCTLYLTKKAPLKDEYGNIIGIIGNSINISSHKSIKDFIISQTTGNLYWKDREGRYLGCNSVFAKISGLNSIEDIKGKTDKDLFLDSLGEEKVQAIINLDKTVIEYEIEQTLEETRVDDKGNLAFYLTKKSPLKNQQGNIIGLIGTSLDITKQKQAESAKNEFLKNMSHDIRTPLVGVYSLARILYNEETDQEKRGMLADMIQSSERLTALLNQILEIVNLSSYSIQNDIFNLNEAVEENIGLLLAAMKTKKILFSFHRKDGLVKIDKVRFNRIFTNLLSNAIKFTPECGRIYIEIESIAPFLCITIEDTGIGIPEDKLEIIFEKFTKLTPSHTQPRFVGSGIGLFIAKQFITELGGEITATSQIGKGSTFSIVIPNLININ